MYHSAVCVQYVVCCIQYSGFSMLFLFIMVHGTKSES
jgi:hypothetical protein